MHSVTRRLLAAVASVPLAAGLIAASEAAPTAATETLYISAGCPQDTPGTCTSTRWLGTQSGDATSNFLTATTPVDEALYRAQGSINWRDYPSDLTFAAEGYVLDATRDLEIDVTVVSNVLAVNNTVHARARLNLCDVDADGNVSNCSDSTVTAADQTVTILPQSEATVAFDVDLPDSMQGKLLRRMTVEIAVHGVNAQGGYIDQEGGSPVRIPYLKPAA